MTVMAGGWLGCTLGRPRHMVIRRRRKELWWCQCFGENSRIMESDATLPRVGLLCFVYTGASPWPYGAFRKIYVPATASVVVEVPDTRSEPELFSAEKENS